MHIRREQRLLSALPLIVLALLVLAALGYGTVRLTHRNRPPHPAIEPGPPAPPPSEPAPAPIRLWRRRS